MRKTVISAALAAAAAAAAGAGAFAVAQTQAPPSPPTIAFAVDAPILATADDEPAMAGMRASAEDRAVLLDARIDAIKAALKLTPDQQKLWGPVEAMIRKTADFRNERMLAHMRGHGDADPGAADPIGRMRDRAGRMAEHAQLLRELADAAAPLYASLSADQKRRVFLLVHGTRGDVVDSDRTQHHHEHWP